MGGKYLTQEEAISRFKTIHGEKFDYSNTEYLGCRHKINIFCNSCKNDISVSANNHFQGKGCPICFKNKTRTLEEFLDKAKDIYQDKFIYIDGYKNSASKIKLKCTICNHIFERVANHHLLGQDCKQCVNKSVGLNNRTNIEDFESECRFNNLDKYIYFQDYIGNNSDIKVQCKDCNTVFYANAKHHKNRISGCPDCSMTNGEQLIKYWLNLNSIKYETQKIFKECRNVLPLRFDFYLSELKTIIEFDGKQHFEAIEYFGGEDSFIKTKTRDNIKNEFCRDNNIKMIRISYLDVININNILEKELIR